MFTRLLARGVETASKLKPFSGLPGYQYNILENYYQCNFTRTFHEIQGPKRPALIDQGSRLDHLLPLRDCVAFAI